MTGRLFFVNQDEDDETAIPIDNVSHIIKVGGRAEIILKGYNAIIKTKKQYDYVVYVYNAVLTGRK